MDKLLKYEHNEPKQYGVSREENLLRAAEQSRSDSRLWLRCLRKRYQKESKQKAAGAEEYLTSREIKKWENEHHITDGNYFDWMQCSPVAQARKRLAIWEHITI